MKPHRIESLIEGMLFSDEKEIIETDLDTYWRIGQMGVLATPILVAFIEQTIVKFLHQIQGPSFETICLETNIKHIMPGNPGDKLICNIHLKFIDENKLFFDVAVLNQHKDEISIGAQERQVV